MSEDKQPLEQAVPVEKEMTDQNKKINWFVMFKRCIGEILGTAVLVCIGCGAATGLAMNGASVGEIAIATSLTFGLVVTALSYALGEFTGCHVNPAVTFAMWLDGRIGWKQMLLYTLSQVVGGIIGAALLVGFLGHNWDPSALAAGADMGIINTYASNAVSGTLISRFGTAGGYAIGLFAEIFFALVFVFTILCTSHDKANKCLSGIALGLSLTSIVFFGFSITGTGVNPARSLGTALMALVNGQTEPIKEIWIFIFGPYIGAGLATLCYWAVWHDHGPHHPNNKRNPTDKIKEKIDSKENK